MISGMAKIAGFIVVFTVSLFVLLIFVGCLGAFGGVVSKAANGGFEAENNDRLLAKANLELHGTGSDRLGNYYVVRGTVRNNGTKAVSFVQVKASLVDKAGSILDTNTTYAISSPALLPGEAKSFSVMVSAVKKATDYRVTLMDGFKIEG